MSDMMSQQRPSWQHTPIWVRGHWGQDQCKLHKGLLPREFSGGVARMRERVCEAAVTIQRLWEADVPMDRGLFEHFTLIKTIICNVSDHDSMAYNYSHMQDTLLPIFCLPNLKDFQEFMVNFSEQMAQSKCPADTINIKIYLKHIDWQILLQQSKLWRQSFMSGTSLCELRLFLKTHFNKSKIFFFVTLWVNSIYLSLGKKTKPREQFDKEIQLSVRRKFLNLQQCTQQL